MARLVDRADLLGVRIVPLESGPVFVQARCPLCREIVRLHLAVGDVEMGREAAASCLSGRDWPGTFELHARYSPEETDAEDGVDVWGLIYEKED